eukprot:TRINITY_DN22237_c0_g1_i1.p1 TRINITY_DN22237_c0_g1~~TRINITY_DN22237_c0_g1_i1.p1  ORF type:complete len:299 (+),score=33.18 TRINITY_DN22237_c0_g1_i1:1-897(+)
MCAQFGVAVDEAWCGVGVSETIQLERLLHQLRSAEGFDASLSLEMLQQLFAIYSHNAYALLTYNPLPANPRTWSNLKPVMLLAAEQIIQDKPVLALGWESTIPWITTVETPGNHYSIMTNAKNSNALALRLASVQKQGLRLPPPEPALLEMRGAADEACWPLSEIQAAYVFAEQHYTGLDGIHPHNYLEFQFSPGTFDLQRFTEVLRAAMRQYPALRTILHQNKGDGFSWCTLPATDGQVVAYQPRAVDFSMSSTAEQNRYWERFRLANDKELMLVGRGFPSVLILSLIHISEPTRPY